MPYFSPDNTVTGQVNTKRSVRSPAYNRAQIRLTGKAVIETGIITNLVSTSGSRSWHRNGVNERKGHEHICSLSPPFHFQWLHLRHLSPYSGLVYCFRLVPCLCFSFSFFPPLSFAREVFLQYSLRGKCIDFDFAHTHLWTPPCWSRPSEGLDHSGLCLFVKWR